MVEKDLLEILRGLIAELNKTLFIIEAGIEPTSRNNYEELKQQMAGVRKYYKRLVEARIKREQEVYNE